MKRKPGEIVQKLAARITQAAATCDFANIENPLDEALRTRFICSINNEAVLKALLKINDDELTFEKAIPSRNGDRRGCCGRERNGVRHFI